MALKDKIKKLKDKFKKRDPEAPENIERMKKVIQAARRTKG